MYWYKEMAEKNLQVKEKIEHSGIFNFADLYGFTYGWLKDHNYGVSEDKYGEKISGNNKDIDVDWKATRKISDYFKIEHAIKFEVKGLSDVEVEIEGKKQKTNKGKVTIELK